MENIITQLQQLLNECSRLREENSRLRQAIIIHNIEVGPVRFLSEEDLTDVDFNNAILRFGDNITLGLRDNPLARAAVTSWEQLKKEEC